jgi:UDPglucose 6-dehydrogenase
VPVGTGRRVARILGKVLAAGRFDVASNPEFLREGSAIQDFMRPDRVVIGTDSAYATSLLQALYRPLYLLETPVVLTTLETAELIKYAANAFLATKITFINEMADLCEALGADVKEVAAGMGYDRRIGAAFLDAGLGFGGSCFPKDVRALSHMAAIHGCHPQLLRAVMEINADQRRLVVQKLRELLDGLDERVVGVLGLAFKPNTDDMRDSPALAILPVLHEAGARVRAFDPQGMPEAARLMPQIAYCGDAYATMAGAAALVLITEWNEFRALDLGRVKALLRQPLVIDLRNIYQPEEMAAAGFVYHSIGRPAGPAGGTRDENPAGLRVIA